MLMYVVKDRFEETPDKDFDTIEEARLDLTERVSQGYAVYLFVDRDTHTPQVLRGPGDALIP